jgi:hypothetical protein
MDVLVHTSQPVFATLTIEDLSLISWQATAHTRRDLHLSRHGATCPTRSAPYSSANPTGAATDARCDAAGCVDLFHDVLADALKRLRATTPETVARVDEPVRYVSRMIGRLVVDRARGDRVRLGLPAKPCRTDGRAGRVRDALRAADPERAEWLEALLRMLLSYANKAGRTAPVWPLDGWALEKCKHDHQLRDLGVESREEIRSDIAEVIRTATTVLGPAWVHVNIHHPLLCAMPPEAIDEAVPAPPVEFDDLALTSWLRTAYVSRRRAGESPDDAARWAVRRVTGQEMGAPNPEARRAIRELEESLASRQ